MQVTIKIIISGSGLWKPPHVITNEELVHAYNGYAEQFNTQNAEGIQIFIGTENRMFEHSGWSMVISPYKTEESRIIGAIGVIGPTCLNYGRIIPIVDYTSKIVARMVGS